jgi:Tol biopolymer transport system component
VRKVTRAAPPTPYPSLPDASPDSEFAPDWSPDGRYLAVTLGTAIWKFSLAGERAQRLANGFDPAWSRDGEWIALVSDRDGDADIYVVASDGSGERRLYERPKAGHPG